MCRLWICIGKFINQVVILPQIDLDNALKTAEKLRKKINNFDFKDKKKISCSFGVTILNGEDTAEKFVKRADKGLYKAKENGRDRVVGVKAN